MTDTMRDAAARPRADRTARFGPATRVAAVFAGTAAAAGAAILALAWAAGINPEILVRDPAQQFGFVVYAGFVSVTGVFLLIAAAAVSAFAALLVPKRRAVLLGVAALSVFIAYDDQFVFHDRIAGVHLGIPGSLFMAAYGVAAAGLLLHPAVRKGPLGPGGLLLAFGLLGLSAAVDLFLPYSVAFVALEDLAKLAGYAAWATFWALYARSEVLACRVGGIE